MAIAHGSVGYVHRRKKLDSEAHLEVESLLSNSLGIVEE